MLAEPQCSLRRCKHFVGVRQDADGELSERVMCHAFTDRIPDEISYGDNLHLTPHPAQQNDIVYEQEPGAVEAVLGTPEWAGDLERTVDAAFAPLAAALAAIQPPHVTVNVPEREVHITMPERETHIHMPEAPAPTVHVTAPQPVITVEAPQVPKIDVHVPATHVDVHVPPRGKTSRRIEHDDEGRPIRIVEE